MTNLPTPKLRKLEVEDARLLYLNFTGREGKYNAKGQRNFVLVLPEDKGKELKALGWNVKEKPPREEGDAWSYQLTVAVRYDYKPPKVWMITSKNRTELPEDLVEMVDYADIETVDVVINPHHWHVNGNTGVKAYLGELWFKIHESSFALKYDSIPIAGAGPEMPALEGGVTIRTDYDFDGEIVGELEEEPRRELTA